MILSFKKFVFGISVLSLIFAGSKIWADDTTPNIFAFSTAVPKDQRKTVQQDLSLIPRLTFNDSSGYGARLFGTPLDSAHLLKWLSERSHYIVSEKYKYQDHIKVLAQNYVYPNADVPIYYEVPITAKPKPLADGQKVYVGMANVGSGIYRDGKNHKSLWSVDIPGIGPVMVNSPRTGIFKVGEGLFLPLMEDSETWISTANSLRRLMMYFHEARHSDGNGKALTFAHSPCPVGSSYAGFYGCDRNQNGPYTIGGTFLRSTVEYCEKCSAREKEALRNLYADQFSRILSEGLILNVPVSAAPVDSASDTCSSLKNLNVSTGSACSSNAAPLASAAPPSAPLNPNVPEPRPAWLNDAPEIGTAP